MNNSYSKIGLLKFYKDLLAKFPDRKVLFSTKGRSIGYYEIVKFIESSTNFFSTIELQPWQRVAVFVDDDIDFCLLAFSIKETAVYVPLDPGLPVDKLSYYLDLMNVDFIITDKESCASYKAAINIGIGIMKYSTSDTLGADRLELLQKPNDINKGRSLKKDNHITVQTTSGTTSAPKIVPTTIEALLQSMKDRPRFLDLTINDIALVARKTYKNSTISIAMMMSLIGGKTVFANGFRHSDFIRSLEEFQITICTLTPSILESLASYIRKNKIKPGKYNLRFIRASGAPLNRDLKNFLEEFLGTIIAQSYGMTETKNIACTLKVPNGYKEGSVGVTTGLEVKIHENEIMVKGIKVFDGYENPEIDNDTYFSDGWFHTGDMGKIDEDGYIFITGRIKEMINRGGEKVSPYEVEEAILQSASIISAAVFPYPGNNGSEEVGAVIVIEDSIDYDLKTLRRSLNEKITAYKMPTKLFIVDEIPIGENNKIKRRQLYDTLIKGCPESEVIDKENNKEMPLKGTQKKVFRIWKSILRKKTGIDILFTDTGGDSLNGAEFIAAIERVTGVRIPVNLLFENGTIRNIAKYIDANLNRADFDFLVPIKLSGTQKPLICVHSGAGDATTYRYIGRNMYEDRPVYALRFDSKIRKWGNPLTFEELAQVYIQEIVKLDPVGPYYICGNCWGGILAYKIAVVMKSMGMKIGMLAMFDSASKANRKTRSRKFTQSFMRRIRESLKQMKGASFEQRTYLFLKKTSNILNLFKMNYSKRVYRFGKEKNMPVLMKLTAKTGALGFAYQNYVPEKYNGKVHFFKATKGQSKTSENYLYWENICSEFELIMIDCFHNDMIVGKYSKQLIEIMKSAMGEVNE